MACSVLCYAVHPFELAARAWQLKRSPRCYSTPVNRVLRQSDQTMAQLALSFDRPAGLQHSNTAGGLPTFLSSSSALSMSAGPALEQLKKTVSVAKLRLDIRSGTIRPASVVEAACHAGGPPGRGATVNQACNRELRKLDGFDVFYMLN